MSRVESSSERSPGAFPGGVALLLALCLASSTGAVAGAERRDFSGRSAASAQTAREAQAPKAFAPAEMLWSGLLPGGLGPRAEAAVVCTTRHLANGAGVRGVRVVCAGEAAEVGPGLAVRRRRTLPAAIGRSDRTGYAKLAWSGDSVDAFLRPDEEYLVSVACSSSTGNRRKWADSFEASCALVRRQPCVAAETALCLGETALGGDGRFRVESEWEDPVDGQMRPASAEGVVGGRGVLVFGSLLGNPRGRLEVTLQDGCAGEARAFSIRAIATETVGYLLRIADTETGRVREYTAEAGTGREAIRDAQAFETCP